MVAKQLTFEKFPVKLVFFQEFMDQQSLLGAKLNHW
jgi:hypothetical protein